MINTVDKLCKADTEEDTTKRIIDKYIDHLEDAYGPLTDRVQEINQRNRKFEELVIEADIIKAHGNIFTYEKQGKGKIPTTLTDDQIDDISNELEERRTRISDNFRTAQYSQKGVDQLML